jgi:hypothetical protein
VNETVEDRVGDSRMGNVIVPSFDGHLTGDHSGARTVSVFEDLEHVAALQVRERHQPPVIEDEHVCFCEACQQACVRAVSVRKREFLEEVLPAARKRANLAYAGIARFLVAVDKGVARVG